MPDEMGRKIRPNRFEHGEVEFRKFLSSLERPRILELGTLRWGDESTHHRHWREDADWVLSDCEPGIDVDVVADAHDLAPFGDESFDAVLAVSVWEHLAQPWEACVAVNRVLRSGGHALIVTHHTFPVHGYPSDYFRFTDEGMKSIVRWGGLEPIVANYDYPATIVPPREVEVWNEAAPAYLNVGILARKP